MKTKVCKMLSAALVLTLALASAFTLTGCADKSDKVVFMFKNGDIISSVDIEIAGFEGKMLVDVLKSAKYSQALSANIDETTYAGMPFLNSIYGLKPKAENSEYIGVYTTLEDCTDSTEITLTALGVVFYYSNRGIGDLPVVKGAVYLFALES